MASAAALAKMVKSLYADGQVAYWLSPVVLHRGGSPFGRIQPGDSVIFCCRRGEREIQLTEAFTEASFSRFPRRLLEPLTFVPLVLYHPRFCKLPVAFRSSPIRDTLGEVVSRAGLPQLRLAEEEKLAHVTFFLNGKRGKPFPGEDDRSVPSFLEDPLRALPELTALLRNDLNRASYRFAVVNIATGDLLGHSVELALKEHCAEGVDRTLQEVLTIAAESGFTSAITADHGLLEEHGLPGGSANTSHTTHPVPFVIAPPSGDPVPLVDAGTLADVAPTLLAALDLPIPEAMVGHSLLRDGSFNAERVLLVVLDGWGLPEAGHISPIHRAHTPTWDRLRELPMSRLEASGGAVGLPPGRKGNSESGHLTIGAGRAVPQDEVRIDDAIRNGTFAQTEAFQKAFADASRRGGAVHLIALLSRTSSHGSIEYAMELVRHASAIDFGAVFLHVITDGRSSKSERVPDELIELGRRLDEVGTGGIVTLVGRGLALDRGGSYEQKTRPTYEALVEGRGVSASLDG